jgi:hypothetical protein
MEQLPAFHNKTSQYGTWLTTVFLLRRAAVIMENYRATTGTKEQNQDLGADRIDAYLSDAQRRHTPPMESFVPNDGHGAAPHLRHAEGDVIIKQAQVKLWIRQGVLNQLANIAFNVKPTQEENIRAGNFKYAWDEIDRLFAIAMKSWLS